MISYNETAQKILFEPLKEGGDHIYILSGYAAPTMLSWYIKNLEGKTSNPISINLIVGMTASNGISLTTHEGFLQIEKSQTTPEVKKVSCSYVYDLPAVHSNFYIWADGDKPIRAFVGSAEFVQNSFIGRKQEELMVSFDPAEAMNYWSTVSARSIYAKHCEIAEYVKITRSDFTDKSENKSGADGESTVRLSLLSKDGHPGRISGLNWGHRKGRNKNEAYIPLPRGIALSGFFPLERRHFSVITDDRKNLILRVEQQGDKAITTPDRNSAIGEYFRNRLGLSNGAFITRADLVKYGRTDVAFTKIDEETFYMDFASEK